MKTGLRYSYRYILFDSIGRRIKNTQFSKAKFYRLYYNKKSISKNRFSLENLKSSFEKQLNIESHIEYEKSKRLEKNLKAAVYRRNKTRLEAFENAELPKYVEQQELSTDASKRIEQASAAAQNALNLDDEQLEEFLKSTSFIKKKDFTEDLPDEDYIDRKLQSTITGNEFKSEVADKKHTNINKGSDNYETFAYPPRALYGSGETQLLRTFDTIYDDLKRYNHKGGTSEYQIKKQQLKIFNDVKDVMYALKKQKYIGQGNYHIRLITPFFDYEDNLISRGLQKIDGRIRSGYGISGYKIRNKRSIKGVLKEFKKFMNNFIHIIRAYEKRNGSITTTAFYGFQIIYDYNTTSATTIQQTRKALHERIRR